MKNIKIDAIILPQHNTIYNTMKLRRQRQNRGTSLIRDSVGLEYTRKFCSDKTTKYKQSTCFMTQKMLYLIIIISEIIKRHRSTNMIPVAPQKQLFWELFVIKLINKRKLNEFYEAHRPDRNEMQFQELPSATPLSQYPPPVYDFHD